MSDQVSTFLCSFCEKPVRFKLDQLGRRGKCPKCQTHVVLVDNQNANVDHLLSTSWFYQRIRLIRGREDVGPITDVEFLAMVQKGQLAAGDEVKSPELTASNWVDVARLNLSVVEERIRQRKAEQRRRHNALARRRKADQENRIKLKRGIRLIVESGTISASNREAIEKFATAAGIRNDELQQTISSESAQLIREVFEEALEDGILEPREEQQLSQLAISLGVSLDFNKSDQARIALCRLAYELDSGTFSPSDDLSAPFKLTAKESALAMTDVVWYEVVTLKRPAGIPLGNDNYLKEIGSGTAYLTTKQVSMIGELQSKKFTLNSVQRVTRYADGILFNRSSGKSVFLLTAMQSEQSAGFGLIAEHACSGEPVLGFSPTSNFLPDIEEAEVVEPTIEESHRNQQLDSDPRYTFRVVGDFVGNREAHLRKLRVGDTISLLREPGNEFDPNAVAVFDSSRNQLGYLKRDVASWFSPVLGRKPEIVARVHCFTSEGALIAGVYF